MADDNWKHRGENMRCMTCMWFVEKPAEDTPTGIGRCRRRAPTLDGWPAIFPADWCGDHKLDETKL